MSITVQLPADSETGRWAQWLIDRPDILASTPFWADSIELEPESDDLVYGTWHVSRGAVEVDQTFTWDARRIVSVDEPKIYAGPADAVELNAAKALVRDLSDAVSLLTAASRSPVLTLHSERLESLRKEHGIDSDADLARVVGVEPATLYRVREGKTVASNEFLAKVAVAFPGASLDHLFTIAQASDPPLAVA